MNTETTTEHSPTLGALAKALAAAQRKISGAARDRKNPHTGSMYADLASVWSAIREPISENGLAVVQTTEPHGDAGVCVVTWLLHESGEYMVGRLFVPAVGQRRKDGTVLPIDAQSFGSALTYARRYALMAIVGVAPEDDDGEQAVRHSREQGPAPAKAAPREPVKEAPKAPPATPAIDVDALLQSLTMATTIDELAEASRRVGDLRDKLSKPDLAKLRAAFERTKSDLVSNAPEAA